MEQQIADLRVEVQRLAGRIDTQDVKIETNSSQTKEVRVLVFCAFIAACATIAEKIYDKVF